MRCSSSKCEKFVLFSDHFCAHCGEANEKFDPVEEATNKEGQRTGWLGKRPGEFDPKSLAAEFEESFVEETKAIVGDLLADLNTRSGKGKVVADIGKVVLQMRIVIAVVSMLCALCYSLPIACCAYLCTRGRPPP